MHREIRILFVLHYGRRFAAVLSARRDNDNVLYTHLQKNLRMRSYIYFG